jgi:hypothetical protein
VYCTSIAIQYEWRSLSLIRHRSQQAYNKYFKHIRIPHKIFTGHVLLLIGISPVGEEGCNSNIFENTDTGWVEGNGRKEFQHKLL